MRLLLDTHAVIWVLTGDNRLTDTVVNMILAPGNDVFFSDASIWEIAIKNYKNPKLCPYKEEYIFNKCIESGFKEMQIKKEHIFGIKNLSVREGYTLSNLDPFDRILLSQSKSEGCIFLTADSNMDNYDEPSVFKL